MRVRATNALRAAWHHRQLTDARICAVADCLVNPDQVLTKTELARLAQARLSEKTVMIRKPSMDSAAGEDLSWFWRGWYQHNWKLDLAVTGVHYPHNDPKQGARVTVATIDKFAMPAMLEVTYTDGSTAEVRVPVATWMQHRKFDVAVPAGKRIKSATIDPQQVLPDVNRANDTFTANATRP